MRGTVVTAVAILMLGACSRGHPARTAPATRADVITHPEIVHEIARAGTASAYDVIRDLRPAWLVTTTRNVRMPVCLDGGEVGDHTIEALRQIPATGIGIIELLGPNQSLRACGKPHDVIFIETL